jgi:hypothetical protein
MLDLLWDLQRKGRFYVVPLRDKLSDSDYSIKKWDFFLIKSPIFGVWLPVVDELRTFDGISGEAGTDSW